MPDKDPQRSARWLASAAEVEDWVASSAGDAAVGVDTEFMRTQTFHAELGLVQLAIGDRIALLDPLAPGSLEAVQPLMTGPRMKLMHSASEDLEVLGRACRGVPQPLFDTQIAASLCGYSQPPSYQKLVAEELGVHLEKHSTRTDWLKRPLDPEQLAYAAEDVAHLAALHALLAARLEALGRSAWMAEECQRAVTRASQPGDPNPHWKIRSLERLEPARQRLLWRLLSWREREAVARNRPRRWILDDGVAISVAHLDHADLASVEAAIAADGKPAPKLAPKLLALLQQEPSAEEQALEPIQPLNPEEKERARELRETVQQRAGELGIASELLLNRRGLEHYARHRRLPAELRGWRTDVLGLEQD